MNDNVNSISNETDSFNGDTTGAGHENFGQNMSKPTQHFFIRQQIKATDVWKEFKVLSIQPKQTEKYKNWVKVHIVEEQQLIGAGIEKWNELSLTADQEMS